MHPGSALDPSSAPDARQIRYMKIYIFSFSHFGHKYILNNIEVINILYLFSFSFI